MCRREALNVFIFKLFKNCNFYILFIYSLKIYTCIQCILTISIFHFPPPTPPRFSPTVSLSQLHGFFFKYINIHTNIYVYKYAYPHICTYINIHICVHTYIHTCVCVLLCVCCWVQLVCGIGPSARTGTTTQGPAPWRKQSPSLRSHQLPVVPHLGVGKWEFYGLLLWLIPVFSG